MGHAWLYPGQLPAVHFLTVGQRPRSPHAGAPGTLGVVDVSATGPPPLPRLRAGEHRSLIHAFCVFPNEGDASLAVNHLLAWRMPARMGLDKALKWSSRRGSNPHSVSYSGAQSLHVYLESHQAERYNS